MPVSDETVRLAVENLGGIDAADVTLADGVSVLTGRNATNRTSLLRALGAALGGSTGALKADADRGSVTLSLGGDSYTRTFERDGETVRVGGDPYTDRSTLVDQYCSLLADNPARRAVAGADAEALRSFIMAPVDTDDLESRIRRTRRAVESLREDRAAAERTLDRRPRLERRLADHREALADVRAELDEVRAAIDGFETDREAAERAEAVVDDLTAARETYERVSDRLETQRDALASLREEREDVCAALSDLSAPDVDHEPLEAEIERLQRRERDLETTISSLLSIVEFNERLTGEGELPGLNDAVADGATGTVECWTCGTTVEPAAIEDRLDDLRAVVDEKRAERNEVRSTLQSRRADLEDRREVAQRRETLEAELDDIEAEIADREATAEELATRADELESRIEALETAAEEWEHLRESDILATYRRRSELEYERGQLEEQIESVEAELARVDEAAERREDIEGRLDERESELERLRTRIESLGRSAVETFNDHMETVRSKLGYENVERVWIERTATDAAESEFALHVVRSTAEGTVYEDTIDHLSESERETIGLVVALAGYLVHGVHETVPVMLLDSLEAIDAERIADLLAYFADFADHLAVALLPEDAQALPDEYERIEMRDTSA
ncbi:archaea-specific SMC-related protein [Haloarcula onubensis]|uniref:Chromosome segregation protein SMC n=1 Tax=Haloarcula onubensis TaxID=2950539 RepID=A0ABU2FV31_9EURY|nr:archaea-specific SMC-related protein [Halomicroarcula sp. S3CR25-11]MDS0284625.1 chromosome segregation protein SMC [Halomicroarcula sp. S3CR25-11]